MGENHASGMWAEPGVPHRGWKLRDVEDLGSPSETCEMCGAATIRYVHVVAHPEYPCSLRAGYVCAGALTDDYITGRRRERELRALARARARFVSSPRWKRRRDGGSEARTDQAAPVMIGPYRSKPGWWVKLGDKFLSARCGTRDEAALAAFDALARSLALRARGKQ